MDKKHGHGVYTWPDGRVYDGQWVNGRQDGMGKYTDKEGITKVGMWSKGKRTKWTATIAPDGTLVPISENRDGNNTAEPAENGLDPNDGN